MNAIKKNYTYLFFVIPIFVLLLPDFILGIYHFSPLNFLGILISKICLLLFFYLIIFQYSKSHFYTYLIVGIPYLISSVVEIFNISILKDLITVDGLKALFYTSFKESQDFFWKFYIYLGIPVLLIVIFIYFAKEFRKFEFILFKTRKRILISLVLLCISLSVSSIKVINSGALLSGKNQVANTIRQCYLLEHPFSIFYRTYQFSKLSLKIKKHKAEKENYKFGSTVTKGKPNPELIVLIIGEKMRYKNFAINGYKNNTSPNLLRIENLTSYNKNYSNANCTCNSIPLIITNTTPQNFDDVYAQKTIVSLFKEAGYKTYWISSNSDIFTYIDNQNEPDLLVDLCKSSQQHSDLDIIPAFETILGDTTSNNKFVVINMLGGHGGVPSQFQKFKPNSASKNYPITAQYSDVFTNDYDNLILFQDYVISKLIELSEIPEKSSFLCFTSDHGCNLFDDGSALFGYGSSKPTEAETHVPLFIWESTKYKSFFTDKVKCIINHKDLPTTNNNLFCTIADMANINFKNFEKSQSFANPDFKPSDTREVYMFNGVFEFKN